MKLGSSVTANTKMMLHHNSGIISLDNIHSGGGEQSSQHTLTQIHAYNSVEKKIVHQVPSGNTLGSLNTKKAPSVKYDIKEVSRIYSKVPINIPSDLTKKHRKLGTYHHIIRGNTAAEMHKTHDYSNQVLILKGESQLEVDEAD